MDDKLEAGSPCGCGIGNIIYAAAKEDGKTELISRMYATDWINAFVTRKKDNLYSMGSEPRCIVRDNGVLVQVIGHSPHEGLHVLSIVHLPTKILMKLEWEFETTEMGNNPDEIMFNRLMACIAVLDKYFGIPSIAQEEVKESFIKVKPSLCNTKTREMVLTTY